MKKKTDLQKRDYIGNDTESPRERGRMIRQSCASFSILRTPSRAAGALVIADHRSTIFMDRGCGNALLQAIIIQFVHS